MHRTHADQDRGGDRARLEALTRERPEWRAWIALLELALQEMGDHIWTGAEIARSPAPSQEAPLLDGATIRLNARAAGRWVRRLVGSASGVEPDGGDEPFLASAGMRRLDATELLAAAVREDEARLDEIARRAGAEPRALAAVARLAALPLLDACRRRLLDDVPPIWWRGFCPICGAWPSFTEMRGLERERRLRCGRCGCDWGMPVLRCPFCEEKDHRRLGALMPEEEQERRRVDFCRTCNGYVKTLNTLTAVPAREVPLEDLATVELDIAAVERGFRRPERPGFTLDVTLESRGGFAARMRGRSRP